MKKYKYHIYKCYYSNYTQFDPLFTNVCLPNTRKEINTPNYSALQVLCSNSLGKLFTTGRPRRSFYPSLLTEVI